MIDYLGSYGRFLRERGTSLSGSPDRRREKARALGLEGHHAVPKCMGGARGKNIVYLTPVDHMTAHWLLNAALVQRGREPVTYVPSNMPFMTACRRNFAMEWNPLSKIRVSFEYGGFEKTVLLTEAAKAVSRFADFGIRVKGLPDSVRQAIKDRGNLLPHVLAACSRRPDERRLGHIRVSIVVDPIREPASPDLIFETAPFRGRA